MAKADPRPVKRIRRKDQRTDKEAARKFFKVGVCHMCNLLGSENHHVVSQQQIRKAGFGEQVRWDLRNRMVLCSACHDDHHSRKHPIPFSALPPSVLEFADEYGFTEYLRRHYK